jgi:O-antigen/teichoic acid export membrane protein
VTLLLAAKLGAAGLGTYSTAMAVYAVIAIAGEAGVTMFLIRELGRDTSRTASYVVHLSVLALGVSALLTAGAELVIRHVGWSGQVEDAVALVLLAILPKTLNSIQEAVFVVHGRTEFETFSTLVTSAIYVAASVWFLAHGYGVQPLILAFVILEYLVTVVYYVLITGRIAKLRWHFEWPLARRLLGEIKSFTGSSALAALFARPEIIILSLISSIREVGYYSAAVRISEIWLFLPQVFLNNVFPLLTRACETGAERFAEVQAKTIKYCMAYSLPITVGMVALAGPIILALFGPAFAPSVPELRLLAVNVTLFTLMGVFWRSVSARGRQDTVLRVQIVIIATRLTSGVGFVLWLASLGAAIATTLCTGLHVVLLERVVRRAGIPARIVAHTWRFGLAAAVMGVASWVTVQVVTVWVVIPFGALVYGGCIVALRALPREDIRTLRSLLPGRLARVGIRRAVPQG